MHNSKLRIIISGLLINGALFAGGKTYAQIDVNTDTGTAPVDLDSNNTYQISDGLGEVRGANLFHSFDTFNIYQNEIANFQAGSGINNIITRVTGSASTIDGTINSPTNFFLLNTHGIMFGANAQLNITGSFHASTADYMVMGDNELVYTNAPLDAPLTSAPPSAFGFTSVDPAAITVDGDTLTNNGEGLTLVGGKIDIQGTQIQSDNGTIQLASIAGPGEIATDINSMDMTTPPALGTITISDNASVDSSGASGGKIVIRSGQLIMDNASLVSNVTGSAADSATEANIDINTSEVVDMDHWARIQNSANADANAGGININTASLDIKNGSRIETQSTTNADAGNISINTNNVNITGHESSLDPFGSDYTGVRSEKFFLFSAGGHIDITSDELNLQSRGAIESDNIASSQGFASFYGGNITITTNDLKLLTGSHISSLATGNGNGGKIDITANDILISGVHPELFNTEDPTLAVSYISSGSYANPNNGEFVTTGKTGDIDIQTNSLSIIDGARINIFSGNSTNNSGNLNINASNIYISGINFHLLNYYKNILGRSHDFAIHESSSSIQAYNGFFNFFFAPGDTGLVTIDASNITLENGAFISTESFLNGIGSDLELIADNLSLLSGAYITSSNQFANGDSGAIFINAKYISLDASTTQSVTTGIYTSTLNSGNAGSLTIESERLNLTNGATISSESSSNGNGGDIVITALNSVYLENNSSISAKASESSIGNAGNINLHTDTLALSSSSIKTTAIEGNGGNITINADYVVRTLDSSIDAASEQSVSGSIEINSKMEILNSVEQLPVASKEVSFIRDRCYQNKLNSSFTTDHPLLVPNDAFSFNVYRTEPISTTKLSHSKIYLTNKLDKIDYPIQETDCNL